MMDNLISELMNPILRGLNERLSILDVAVARQIDTSPGIVGREGTSGLVGSTYNAVWGLEEVRKRRREGTRKLVMAGYP